MAVHLEKSHTFGPTTPTTRDITTGDLLKEAAKECPDQLAIITGVNEIEKRRHWTYAELYDQAQVAAYAILENFEPGERISVWAPNIPEWVILEFASALAGTILVTVNPSYQPNELAYVLKQSKSVGIFLLTEYRGNRMIEHVEKIQHECSDLRKIIRFDEWDEFLTTGHESKKSLPMVNPSDPTMIQYTSGTTGFPKGALLHHRGLVNNGADTLDRMGVKKNEVWVTTMPLFHTGGCVLCVLGAVSKRATQILVEQFDPGLVLELSETYRSNAMLGVPAMLIAMIEHPEFSSRDLSTIRTVCSGGSTVPAALVKRFEKELGALFTIVFGQTECSPVASMTRTDDTVEDKANTIGSPMPNVEVKITDPESGKTLPINTIGEYCTRGYHVMHGYFEMQDATSDAIDNDGWLHTGDLCSMDKRGYCSVEGRLKDMIIRGGENIYPKEIEELLFQHTTVGEVAIVGLPDDRLGEIVGAFLRVTPGETINKEELFIYLREHLSPQKTPAHWFEVSEFPMTGSGKIQKFVLQQEWQAGKHTPI